MATYKSTRKYTCYNDCQMSGCPGHEAVMTLQSVSDAYVFDDGRGFEHSIRYFDPTILKLFIEMAREVNGEEVPGIKQ